MNTKILLTIGILASSSLLSLADITVTVPESCPIKTLNYFYAPIRQYANAKTRAERGVVADSVSFENSKAVIAIPQTPHKYLYSFNLNDNIITAYVNSDDNLKIDVTNCNPFSYTLSGTQLADGMNELIVLETPILYRFHELEKSPNATEDDYNALSAEYSKIHKDYILNKPDNPAILYALMNLDGEDFISVFESLPEGIDTNILYPLVAVQYENEKERLEMDKRQKALQSGEIEAPNFILENLEGKEISLSDFRGKWVILDFWGSWCPWCIKGFPELKEAYSKYGDKLEIIGIDCRESQEAWKAGVAKYELPWVNVYNPENSQVLGEYGVQGFPTKAIIDPAGKIRNITVGHDPAFFNVLNKLME